MSNWQPIATAPRDGTEFLAYDDLSGKQDVCYMWNIVGDRWIPFPTQCDGELGPSEGEFGYGHEGINNWQPLPERPTAPSTTDSAAPRG